MSAIYWCLLILLEITLRADESHISIYKVVFLSPFRIQLVFMKMKHVHLMSITVQRGIKELLSLVWSHLHQLLQLLFQTARCTLVLLLPFSHTLDLEALITSLTRMLSQPLTPWPPTGPALIMTLPHAMTTQICSLLTLQSLERLHFLLPLCHLLHFHPGLWSNYMPGKWPQALPPWPWPQASFACLHLMLQLQNTFQHAAVLCLVPQVGELTVNTAFFKLCFALLRFN